jgi:tetratricopeptide (TPR) repeat protein
LRWASRAGRDGRPAAPASLVTAQDYLTLGDYDYDRGDCVQAIQDYSHAIAIDPTFAAAYNNRAYTAMRRQDYAAALTDLDRAIAIRPDYIAALMNRGDIYNYYYAIDRQRAMADYDRVIALGGTRQTSVCGHRLLASHDGWNPGVVVDLLTRGIDAGCPSAAPG